jgi:hypothetical protein
MVVGLSVGPSVCFGKVLQSSDEIRSQDGVLAFGDEEFWDLILFDPKVEVGGSRATCHSSGSGHPGCILVLVIASVVGVIITIIVVMVVRVDLDVISSNKSHFSPCFVW